MDAGEFFSRSARTSQPSMSVHPRKFFLLLDVCLLFPLHYSFPPEKKFSKYVSPFISQFLFFSFYFSSAKNIFLLKIFPPSSYSVLLLSKNIFFLSPKIFILFLFILIDGTTSYHIAFNYLTQVSWRLFEIRQDRQDRQIQN